MKHRIKTIFWLLAACMLAINAFQAYWLYATYQLTTAEFDRTVRAALLDVVQQQLIFSSHSLPGNDVAGPYVTMQTPQGGARLQHEDWRRRSIPPLSRAQEQRLRQQVAPAPGVPLARLATAYQAELALRGVVTTAVLDTFRGQAGSGLFRLAVASQPPPAGYPMQTPPVLLDPLQSLYVQACLPTPTTYLWHRMGGLLAGSVGVLVLTSGCFVLLLHTIVQQRRLAEVKNDFINNMTHELKTPLATVSAAIEALLDFGALKNPQRTQQYLRISQQEMQRLTALVEQVLDIAVEEQQPLVVHAEPVHPAALVHDLVRRYQVQASKPVWFEVDIAPTDVVPLDRLHLAGVLNNLLDNALKYSREHVTIRLRGGYVGAGWQLTVQDDGIGIAPRYQGAVFDRFFRVPTGDLHPVRGSGLGLYYVRQVMERHGGYIRVRSQPNHGTEFSLWLPLVTKS
jgi:two-component system phosphate regulon sensor histidine kinase PhoR